MLTDAMWARTGNIPAGRKAGPGVTAADSRPFGGAAPVRFRTGSPWRDLPERFGKWNSVSRRFRRRALSGVSGRVSDTLSDGFDLEHMFVDGTVVQAHRKHPCLESSPDPAFFRLFPVFPGFRVRLSRTFPQRSPQAAPSGHAGNTRRGDPGRMAGDSLSAPDGRGPACRQAAAAVRSSHTRRSRRRALAVTASLRMTATRATLWGFPLPLRRSYSSLMSGEHLLADSAAI